MVCHDACVYICTCLTFDYLFAVFNVECISRTGTEIMTVRVRAFAIIGICFKATVFVSER
jgi:hypothetical protein